MSVHDILDELESLSTVQCGVTDLMSPGLDLQRPQQDNVACLLFYLDQRREKLLAKMRNAVHTQPEPT